MEYVICEFARFVGAGVSDGLLRLVASNGHLQLATPHPNPDIVEKHPLSLTVSRSHACQPSQSIHPDPPETNGSS